MSESDRCTSQMFLKTFSPRVLLLNVSEERMRLHNQHFFSNHEICVGLNHKLSDCSWIVWFRFKRYDFDMGMDAELGTDSDFFNVDYIWSGPI